MEINEKEEREAKRRQHQRAKYEQEINEKIDKAGKIFTIIFTFVPSIGFLTWVYFNNHDGYLRLMDRPLLVLAAIAMSLPLSGIIGYKLFAALAFFFGMGESIAIDAKVQKTQYEKKKEMEEYRAKEEERKAKKRAEQSYRDMVRPDQGTISRCEDLLRLLDNYDVAGYRMMCDGIVSDCKLGIRSNMYRDKILANSYCDELENVLLTKYVDTLIQHPVGYRWVMAHKNW